MESDIEFFFDPVCPWAWITSRWVVEVANVRDLDVDWRLMPLRFVNSEKDYEKDMPPRYTRSHGTGLKLLRVAASVRAEEGRASTERLYTQFGGDIHVRGLRDEIMDEWSEGFPEYLRSVGIPERHISAANEDQWDAELEESTVEAMGRVGDDVGTPIISFRSEHGTFSFFGPVLSRVPRGAEALELWDAVWKVATFPGMSELKRSLREPAQLADSLDSVLEHRE